MQRIAVSTVPAGYDAIIKLMHWLTVGLIIAVFALANIIDMVPDPYKEPITQLHRSVGLTIWVLTVARLIWRQYTTLPDWPDSMSHLARRATAASEYALYALLLSQPVIGLVHTIANGETFDLFFLGNIAPSFGIHQTIADWAIALHGVVANLMLALIGLHAATGLLRYVSRRDKALKTMLPDWG